MAPAFASAPRLSESSDRSHISFVTCSFALTEHCLAPPPVGVLGEETGACDQVQFEAIRGLNRPPRDRT